MCNNSADQMKGHVPMKNPMCPARVTRSNNELSVCHMLIGALKLKDKDRI